MCPCLCFQDHGIQIWQLYWSVGAVAAIFKMADMNFQCPNMVGVPSWNTFSWDIVAVYQLSCLYHKMHDFSLSIRTNIRLQYYPRLSHERNITRWNISRERNGTKEANSERCALDLSAGGIDVWLMGGCMRHFADFRPVMPKTAYRSEITVAELCIMSTIQLMPMYAVS